MDFKPVNVGGKTYYLREKRRQTPPSVVYSVWEPYNNHSSVSFSNNISKALGRVGCRAFNCSLPDGKDRIKVLNEHHKRQREIAKKVFRIAGIIKGDFDCSLTRKEVITQRGL